MSSNINTDKALRDLSVIRQTIDRTTGSSYFMDFMAQLGGFTIIFGMLGILASIATYFLLDSFSASPYRTAVIAGLWALLMLSGGTYKAVKMHTRGKQLGLTFTQYYMKVSARSFMRVYVPYGIVMAIFVIFFFMHDSPLLIIPACITFIGLFFNSLGMVFAERSLVASGYLFLFLGGIGLTAMDRMFFGFSILAFAGFTVMGLLIRGSGRGLEKDSGTYERSGGQD
jgi:hypothetical protein